jgi:peptidoglycan/LPS O-acetylase OafA/YrhL
LVGVESLRAFAALAVLYSHAWELSRGYASTTFGQRLHLGGAYGLPLFFALSGYLLFWPFAQAAWGNGRPVSIRRYAGNRLWRILPLYYAVLVLLLVLQPHAGTPKDWVLYATFTENFSYSAQGAINGPMWSLAVEMQFYLLLPLIALVLAKASRGSRRVAAAVLAVVAAASFTARQVITWGLPFHNHLQLLDGSIVLLFFYFALGMGLVLVRLAIEDHRYRWLDGFFGRSTVWLAGALGLWLVACYDYRWELAAGIASALLIGAVVLPLRDRWATAPARWRPIALIGLISYGIYLWQAPVLIAISNRSVTDPTPVLGRGLTELIGIGLPASIALAALTYWQVERLGLARRRRWSANELARPPQSPAAEAAAAPGPAAKPAAPVQHR